MSYCYQAASRGLEVSGAPGPGSAGRPALHSRQLLESKANTQREGSSWGCRKANKGHFLQPHAADDHPFPELFLGSPPRAPGQCLDSLRGVGGRESGATESQAWSGQSQAHSACAPVGHCHAAYLTASSALAYGTGCWGPGLADGPQAGALGLRVQHQS